MKNNYILIDYENVQPENLSMLKGSDFKVIVFVGSKQVRIPFELASALQELGDKATYIKIDGDGPNALDFHIAFYLGKISATDSDAYFHIISRDTGFDPLVKHLRAGSIFVQREKNLAEIPFLRLTGANTIEERIEAIVQRLKALGHSRPRKVKTLKGTINALFFKTLEELELDRLVEHLHKQDLISVEKDKIVYKSPIIQRQ